MKHQFLPEAPAFSLHRGLHPGCQAKFSRLVPCKFTLIFSWGSLPESADFFVFPIQNRGFHGHWHRLPIVKRQLHRHGLSGGGLLFQRTQPVNAHVRKGFHPHRGGNGHIPVGLGHPEQVIGITGGQGKIPLPGAFGNFPGGQHPAVDGQHLRLSHGSVGGIGKPGGELHGLRFFQESSHIHPVQLKFHAKIAVLGGIDPPPTHSLQKGFF